MQWSDNDITNKIPINQIFSKRVKIDNYVTMINKNSGEISQKNEIIQAQIFHPEIYTGKKSSDLPGKSDCGARLAATFKREVTAFAPG